MSHKSLTERWKDEKASDFIVKKPEIELEPIPKKETTAKTFGALLDKK